MIYNSDCQLVDWSEGHVLCCDPPYSAHVHNNATSQSIGGGTRKRDLGFAHLSPELRLWTAQLAAKMPRWSVIFSDIEGSHLWREDLIASGATYIRTIPWVRWSIPQLSGDRPPSGCELIILAYGTNKGRKSWNGPGNLTHFAHTCMRGANKHLTEKPLDLMLDLVDWFSDPGETVIDPFAGSGTTGKAAQLLGRKFIGSELDPKWAEFANARCSTDILSARDTDRYAKWKDSQLVLAVENERRDANTAKSRLKLEAKRQQEMFPDGN